MLFAAAVALALVAGNNQGTVTLFWPPHRVDLSLNLVLLGLLAAFATLHVALRALAALFALPQQARRWRLQQRERAQFVAVLDALSHLLAGRFLRARKSAELALTHEDHLSRHGDSLPYGKRLRVLSHLLAAQSAHVLQDRDGRAAHFDLALSHAEQRDAQEVREGVQLRGAQWALDDHDAALALRWLEALPQGASRRTAAMRLRLKAARLAGQTGLALDTARLLRRHHAFSDLTGRSIVRGLILEQLQASRDDSQLQSVWDALEAQEQADPDVALAAAMRRLAAGGDAAQTRQWLLPIWERMTGYATGTDADRTGLTPAQEVQLVSTLAQSFMPGHPEAAGHSEARSALEAGWLTRIETAQSRWPGDALFLYLAGMACMQLQLWGKAQQMLGQSAPHLRDAALARSAWLALAALAERRDDIASAKLAYQNAIKAVAS
jgi:HemY protein